MNALVPTSEHFDKTTSFGGDVNKDIACYYLESISCCKLVSWDPKAPSDPANILQQPAERAQGATSNQISPDIIPCSNTTDQIQGQPQDRRMTGNSQLPVELMHFIFHELMHQISKSSESLAQFRNIYKEQFSKLAEAHPAWNTVLESMHFTGWVGGKRRYHYLLYYDYIHGWIIDFESDTAVYKPENEVIGKS